MQRMANARFALPRHEGVSHMLHRQCKPEFYAAGHILDHLPHNILAIHRGSKTAPTTKLPHPVRLQQYHHRPRTTLRRRGLYKSQHLVFLDQPAVHFVF